MIDLHCHVLPAIDDGPETLEESVELARVAAAQGTRTIVATPHVNHRFPNRAPEIGAAVAALNERLRSEGIELDVRPGAEIAMTSIDELDRSELERLALGGGGWLLIETPFTLAIDGFGAVVRHLQDRGHGVVLAHPERSHGFQRQPELLAELVARGALTSVTAASLVGVFGKEARRLACDIAAEGLLHNVASDAHDPRHRAPMLAEPLREAGLEAEIDWLTRDVPGAILAGAIPPPRPRREQPAPPPKRRRWWSMIAPRSSG